MKIKSFLSEYGLTLVEIVVATVVLSIVVLTAGTVYIASIKEFRRVSDEARIQFEAAYTLEHIYRNLIGGINIIGFDVNGIQINPWTTSPAAGVRVDIGGTDQVKYALDTSNHTVTFYPDFDANPNVTEKIADYITVLEFKRPLSTEAVVKNNYVTIDITAEKERMAQIYSTGVVLRGMDPSS